MVVVRGFGIDAKKKTRRRRTLPCDEDITMTTRLRRPLSLNFAPAGKNRGGAGDGVRRRQQKEGGREGFSAMEARGRERKDLLAFEEIFEVNLALGIKKGNKQIGFWKYKKFRLVAAYHKQKLEEQWRYRDGPGTVVEHGRWNSQDWRRANSKDKSDSNADTITYGGGGCVAGCGAGCGG
ncbi:hypothetical protein L6452_15430 [Arctium lappa]|uniref:Uncharacterized protein n=1 Tax=Arctium lappa TaxID=4217 RepID=A0ACB9CNW4_ARCLA|nr:hypothetical protein L6452_15430 [Arctium lappa]